MSGKGSKATEIQTQTIEAFDPDKGEKDSARMGVLDDKGEVRAADSGSMFEENSIKKLS